MSYWANTLTQRVRRRRFLATAGSTSAAALLLAACGGGDDSQESASGLLAQPLDTSNEAKPGGIWESSVSADVTTMDPHASGSGGAFNQIVPAYDHLVRYDRGTGGKDGKVIADAAESWEFSPDGLTLTLKLQPNLKFDSRAPTNGRALTASDVVFSYNRTKALSPYAGDWIRDRSPTAPVLSATALDDRTVQMKLAYPYLGTLLVLAHNTYLYVLPREADGGFDPRSEARGTGPFRLEEWVPSVHYSFKKNPDWIEKSKGRPFLDGFKRTVVPDYAAGLAQFEAGHLWDFNVRSSDVLRTKKSHPEMVLRQNWALGSAGFGHTIRLSQQADSVMRDARVRQAASMLIDRETWIRAMHGTDEYEAAGLPAEVKWNSHLPAYLSEWLDPQGKDLGEGAKYFQFNVAEAKKLLAAAGYDRSKSVSFFHSRQQDAAFNSTLQAMMSEGFGTDFQILEHNPQWVQTCQTSLGQGYNGFCYYPVAGFSAENYLQTKYTPEGKTAITDKPIPGLTDLVNKIKTEIDAEKQKQLVKDAQKEAAKLMPDILLPGFSYGFQLNQPWLENYGVYSGTWISARLYLDYWYNAAKKTS